MKKRVILQHSNTFKRYISISYTDMLFAKNSRIDNLEIYISFLNSIIKSDTAAYKDIFVEIIDMSHRVSKREINFSSVPSKIFDVVSLLSINHQEYFVKINPNDIQKKEFEEIKKFIEDDMFDAA